MIKCPKCSSYKVCLKFNEKKYSIINECFNCYLTIQLFIDDYFNNYKEFYSYQSTNNDFAKKYFCEKHNKNFISFCYNCKEILCEECLTSHDSIYHYIQKIRDILDNNDKNCCLDYKIQISNLQGIIEQKIDKINKNDKDSNDSLKLLNSILNMIKLKNIFFCLNINDIRINAYDLISLKNLLNRHNKTKFNLLIENIKKGIFPSQNEINKYNESIYYSFKSISEEKIIHKQTQDWVNHIIQLKNGNIVSAHWDCLLLHKINKETKKLDLITKIRINNGSINHIYEYKPNKILCCDNQMKIVQLSENNSSYKTLNISDYARKIIPFIPYDNIIQKNSALNFLFTATPNGIKVYYYSEENNTHLNELSKDINFLGEFSKDCDYSAIIQVKNKICGIYKNKNEYNSNHFSVWEINYDFDIKNFNKNDFNLLGEIQKVNAGIGRYSLTNVNDYYVLIGRMCNDYYYSKNEHNNGISVVSLEHIEIIQYIDTNDEISAIACLKNGMVLTGGMDENSRKYYIKQYKYNEDEKEIQFISSKNLHNSFINTIDEINNGFFMSCGRDGNIYLIYY